MREPLILDMHFINNTCWNNAKPSPVTVSGLFAMKRRSVSLVWYIINPTVRSYPQLFIGKVI